MLFIRKCRNGDLQLRARTRLLIETLVTHWPLLRDTGGGGGARGDDGGSGDGGGGWCEVIFLAGPLHGSSDALFRIHCYLGKRTNTNSSLIVGVWEDSTCSLVQVLKRIETDEAGAHYKYQRECEATNESGCANARRTHTHHLPVSFVFPTRKKKKFTVYIQLHSSNYYTCFQFWISYRLHRIANRISLRSKECVYDWTINQLFAAFDICIIWSQYNNNTFRFVNNRSYFVINIFFHCLPTFLLFWSLSIRF